MKQESTTDSAHTITTIEQLEALYDAPKAASLSKETRHLTPEYRAWLERAPFFALASSGPHGLDCTPRGDALGQVARVLDERTILIPDRRGNNRLDSLRNIVRDPRVALLFLIPGVRECLRVNGNAALSTAPELIDLFDMNGKRPTCVIRVGIEAVYFQCARAIMRSKLWNTDTFAVKGEVPTAGQMTRSADAGFDAETYDAELLPRQMGTLY